MSFPKKQQRVIGRSQGWRCHRPKFSTKAAFQLAEHLAARHLSAGLKPREEQMKRMRGAWRLVHNSYEGGGGQNAWEKMGSNGGVMLWAMGASQFFGFLFVLSVSCHLFIYKYMIWVFPKLMVGFSLINHPFWGTPIFGNIHMYRLYSCFQFVTQIKSDIPLT